MKKKLKDMTEEEKMAYVYKRAQAFLSRDPRTAPQTYVEREGPMLIIRSNHKHDWEEEE